MLAIKEGGQIKGVTLGFKVKEEPIISDDGGKFAVIVFDYDGTILKERHLNKGDIFTLPPAPSHEGMIFQDWVSGMATITNNQVVVDDMDIPIGTAYTTVSGKSEFDIELTPLTGTTVTFNATGEKDWGDGTTDSLTTHTYTNIGNYTIKTSSGGTTSNLFGTAYNNYNSYLKRARLVNFNTGTTTFQYCAYLEAVSINKTNTNFYIQNNPLLKAVSLYGTISNVPSVGSNTNVTLVAYNGAFAGGADLQNSKVKYQPSVSYGTQNKNANTTSLQRVKVSIISDQGFYSSQSMRYVKVKPLSTTTTTTFGSQAFYGSILEILDLTEVPFVPVLKSDTFSGLTTAYRVVVPDNLYDQYIVATNWLTVANHIVKQSEANL